MKKNNYLTIGLAVLVVLMAGYIGYLKFQQFRIGELNAAAQEGINVGVRNTLTTLYQQTNECRIATITVQNDTRRLADVGCIEQALTQAQQQGIPTPELAEE